MKKKGNKKEILNREKMSTIPEVKTLIKIVIGIILILIIVYFLGGLLTGNIKLKKDEEKVEIQYSEILAEQTFKQPNSEYFVIFYNFDSSEKSLIDALSSDLSTIVSIYKVDLSKKFNLSYITNEKSNKKPTSSNELKIYGTTLIRIKNGKVINYVEGLSNIKEYTLGL
ncbi:MAG: hypothetical protein PUD59_04210 [bacterium]|nr:hypothetical protein [bacterium]